MKLLKQFASWCRRSETMSSENLAARITADTTDQETDGFLPSSLRRYGPLSTGAEDLAWLAREYDARARAAIDPAEAERYLRWARECREASALCRPSVPAPRPSDRASYRRA